MKKSNVLIVVILALGLFSANFNGVQASVKGSENQEVKTKVLYFHASRRCETCMAIEKVTKEALESYYGEEVAFIVLNREEEENQDLVQKYKVSGQTLLIVKDEEVINLTTEAFMNARTNPDKFKSKLKATIDPLI